MKNSESSTTADKRDIEEFEPYCRWQKEGGDKILLIYLNGFKKEKLKVLISRNGIKVSGHRAVDTYTKQIFERCFKLPEDCDKDKIKSKFGRGILRVTFPINEKISGGDDKSSARTSISNIIEMSWKFTERVAMVGFVAYLCKYCPCLYTQN